MHRTAAVISVVALLGCFAEAAVPRKSVWRPSTESLSEVLSLPPENRRHILASQPDSVYDVLLEMANDGERSMSLRWRALTSAAALRKEKAAPDLLKAAKSDQWFMRNAALVGLSEFSPEKSVELAKDLVKDPALVVRSAAVDVLAKYGSGDERSLLWKELGADYNSRGGRSLWIRAQIVKALAEKPRDPEMTRFSALLSEKDLKVQKEAIRGLERLTGMKLGERSTAHDKVVQLWLNYFSQPPSSELR